MNDLLTDRKYRMVVSKIPFMLDFPYPEFEIQYNSSEEHQVDNFSPVVQNLTQNDVISFRCINGILATINVFEKEIWRLYDSREGFVTTNEISRILVKSLEDTSLVIKRNAIQSCERWFSGGTEQTIRVGSTRFSDILEAFTRELTIDQIVSITKAINKLHTKKGIIQLEEIEEKMIRNYYQFQLIYFKLILGIIIAAKISM